MADAPQHLRLDDTACQTLINKLLSGDVPGNWHFDADKHKVIIETGKDLKSELRLALDLLPKSDQQSASEYLIHLQHGTSFILLIQAGAAALALLKDDKLEKHKVIKTYMVRKSQGKSQLTHLKTRGKSRLGSRIRLRNAIKFFIQINEKTHEWNCLDDVDRILYSCPKSLWPHVFDCESPAAFKADDARLLKIPLDINTPDFNELKRVRNYAPHHHLVLADEELKDVLGLS